MPNSIPIPEKKDNLVIENIRPSVNCGHFDLKREPGETVTLTADIFRHGHEKYDAAILYRHVSQAKWLSAPMHFVDNDSWEGTFTVQTIGYYEYKISAWTVEPKDVPTESEVLELRVDPPYARTGTWYEMWPKSQGTNPNASATWKDCEKRLDYIISLGFDTIYLVPIHPIGITNRKGANNSLKAKKGEPGSPYAVGNQFGGHFAIDPELGTMKEFEHFAAECKKKGLRLALDIALNCSPDHPYVKEHPEWFFHEPDGSIKFAENPPKKYEDIYPFDYYNENYQALWQEIRDIILFWAGKGFDIFRIDNPHTKPFPFWQWLIRDVKLKKPEVVFLAEAFTRPKMMHRLAKLGFDMSYTYFTWRSGKWEFEEYLKELTQSPAKEYMRGIFFPTTPDIFPKYLAWQGPAAFKQRYFLAATLSSLTGLYNGYELCENEPSPIKEELHNSEKYQYKVHDWDSPLNIKDFVKRVNEARLAHPALQEYDNLEFHYADNDQLMVYSKKTGDDIILCVANMDMHHTQEGTVAINMEKLGFAEDAFYFVKDLITDESYLWRGSRNFVHLDPEKAPGHLLVVRKF
ncbi:MAG: alpha-1,4-glucan--maltose-1-phosphate maltosyltransferase [Fibrobacter sp.]|jgi:starch synthase (maltosyl-transferring)|nr:alpha-1,4-glucan--maltose-1-phosphate maltosyltransferase [Fibrobacter sp.]